jgi:hypothetical protein
MRESERKAVPFVIAILALVSLACTCSCPCSALSPSLPQQPTPTPIPGWHPVETDLFQIWLPPGFEGWDVEKKRDEMAERLEELNLGPITQDLELDGFVLWGVDPTTMLQSGYWTTLDIEHSTVSAFENLDEDFIQEVREQLEDWAVVEEWGDAPLDRYEAAFFVYSVPDQYITFMTYIVKDRHHLFDLRFITSTDEFDQRRSVFERIVGTLTVH